MLGSGSDDLCTVESRKRAFLVHRRCRRMIENTIFFRCEAFSLTSQKDASGHQKGQAQSVDWYLSLLGAQSRFFYGFIRSGFTTTSPIG
jgi:hypothetical protein